MDINIFGGVWGWGEESSCSLEAALGSKSEAFLAEFKLEAIHLKNPKALAVSWIDFNEELDGNSYRLQGAAQTYWGSLLGDKKALRGLTSWSGVSLFYAPSTVLSMGVFLLIFTNWWLTTDRTEKDAYFLLISEKAFLE